MGGLYFWEFKKMVCLLDILNGTFSFISLSCFFCLLLFTFCYFTLLSSYNFTNVLFISFLPRGWTGSCFCLDGGDASKWVKRFSIYFLWRFVPCWVLIVLTSFYINVFLVLNIVNNEFISESNHLLIWDFKNSIGFVTISIPRFNCLSRMSLRLFSLSVFVNVSYYNCSFTKTEWLREYLLLRMFLKSLCRLISPSLQRV
mgnify:CR=1 FL=1